MKKQSKLSQNVFKMIKHQMLICKLKVKMDLILTF